MQHSCHSLCDQERGWDCQSNTPSYYSTSRILIQQEAAPSQSENFSLQPQSLQSYNTHVIDYIENDNSGKSQACSPATCLFSEIASKEKSDFEIMVEGRPLHVDQIQISPEYLHDYIKPTLLVEDDQPSDLKGDGCTNFFYEECNQPVTIYVTGEILIAIQDQKDENRVDSKHVESDCLPSCFSSFEWPNKRVKVSYQ